MRDDIDRRKALKQALDEYDESKRDVPLSELVDGGDPAAVTGILDVFSREFPDPSGDWRWAMVEEGWEVVDELWDETCAEAIYEFLPSMPNHFRRQSNALGIMRIVARIDERWAGELLQFFERAVHDDLRDEVARLVEASAFRPEGESRGPDVDIFALDEHNEWHLPAEEALTVGLHTARLILGIITADAPNFFGAIRDGETLQFAFGRHDDPSALIADIPVRENGRSTGSYNGPVDYDDAQDALVKFGRSGEHPEWLVERLSFEEAPPPPGKPFWLVQGDIAEAETDAIVNAWNRNFIPHWLLIPQGVAGSLKRAAGPEPFRDISKKGMLQMGEAVATGAGELDVDYIIHAAALHWYWSSSEEAVAKAAQNVFACAEGLGVDSIAIPLLGAGTGGVDPAVSLELIREAWEEQGRQVETEVWVFDEALAERLGGGGPS